MTVTVADIVNRALQLVGTRTTVTTSELTNSSSNEAIQANIAYGPIRDWCFGVVNWNFARTTAKLTSIKTTTGFPTWSTSAASPPWVKEYSLPSDFIRAIYLTNQDQAADSAVAWAGEPQRFVIAADIISTVQQQVLLTNQSSAILVYTARLSDPTNWPWLFERFVVSSLATALCYVLTGDRELRNKLEESSRVALIIAEQANREEGLTFGDTTPEWIQAIGIEYPNRRHDPRVKEPPSDK